jgi:hypothetical protein
MAVAATLAVGFVVFGDDPATGLLGSLASLMIVLTVKATAELAVRAQRLERDHSVATREVSRLASSLRAAEDHENEVVADLLERINVVEEHGRDTDASLVASERRIDRHMAGVEERLRQEGKQLRAETMANFSSLSALVNDLVEAQKPVRRYALREGVRLRELSLQTHLESLQRPGSSGATIQELGT